MFVYFYFLYISCTRYRVLVVSFLQKVLYKFSQHVDISPDSRVARVTSKGSLVRFPAEAYIIIWNFRWGNVVHISAKTTQMNSSMTFIQSNRCTQIDLILKQIWRRFIWWQVSFKDVRLRLIYKWCVFKQSQNFCPEVIPLVLCHTIITAQKVSLGAQWS